MGGSKPLDLLLLFPVPLYVLHVCAVLGALFSFLKFTGLAATAALCPESRIIILKSMWRLSSWVNDDNTVTLFEHLTASIE